MEIEEPSTAYFESEVQIRFEFLLQLGFGIVKSSENLVRYTRKEISIDVYHAKTSYQIGVFISGFGNSFSLSEIIREADGDGEADSYQDVLATTAEGIAAGLRKLSKLIEKYSTHFLMADQEYFEKLLLSREVWSYKYADAVSAEQLRPQANEAFRMGNYSLAAKLFGAYSRSLTQVEIKKYSVSLKRSKN